MLTNDQMKPNRFARWSKARKQFAFIQSALASGKTVQVTTNLRATRYTAKHADLFICKKDGIYVRRGKGMDFIGWANIQAFA
mgnify:FL=1